MTTATNNIKVTKVEAGEYNVTNLTTGDTFNVFCTTDNQNTELKTSWDIEKVNNQWIGGPDSYGFPTLKQAKLHIASFTQKIAMRKF